MGRTIIVGDVHGCAGELDDLLAAVGFRAGDDRLVLVGDLVARGPDSRGVIERMMAYGAEGVRGNHDEKVLAWWRVWRRKGRKSADRAVPLSARHRAVVESLAPQHFEVLDALPLRLALPAHGVVVVHAGVDPSRRPEDCDADTLLTVRSIDEGGRLTRKLQGTPWATRWRGPEHIVFGHDARRDLQCEPFATGLDTGCVYGRHLSALVLAAGQGVPAEAAARAAVIARVPARATYCPPGTSDGPE